MVTMRVAAHPEIESPTLEREQSPHQPGVETPSQRLSVVLAARKPPASRAVAGRAAGPACEHVMQA